MAPLLASLLALALPAALATETKLEAGPLETPLNASGSTLQNVPALAPGSLELPPTVVPGETLAAVVPAAFTATPQATEQAYVPPPAGYGRAVAARPYYAVALERAGLDPKLAESLQNYLTQRGRFPGPQDDVYSGLHHAYDVAALAARLTEAPESAGLTREKKALLILAAALRSVDPRRAPGSPADVKRTLEYIDDDPQTKGLIENFTWGNQFKASQLKALLAAAGETPEALAARARLSEEFHDGEFAKLWARRLSFAERVCAFVGDVDYADRQIRGRANERGVRSLELAKGAAAELKALRAEPDFALLPTPLRDNFDVVESHFQEVAAHPERFERSFPPARGPPQNAERAYAQAAAQPVSPALAAQLADFQKRGLMILSDAGAVDPALIKSVLAALTAESRKNDLDLYARPTPFERASRPDYDGWLANPGNIRALVARLEHLVNLAAPGERIVPVKAALRVEYDSDAAIPRAHIDSRYATLTLALEGPGTVFWDDSSGRVEYIEAPTGAASVQTAVDRAAKLGVPGTVHASPSVFVGRRVLLVINFEREGSPSGEDAQARRHANQRTESVLRRYEAQQKARGRAAQPPRRGLLGAIRDFLE